MHKFLSSYLLSGWRYHADVCCTACVRQTMTRKARTSERSSEQPLCGRYRQEITWKLSRFGRPKSSVLGLCSFKCCVFSSGLTVSPLRKVNFPLLLIGLLLVNGVQEWFMLSSDSNTNCFNLRRLQTNENFIHEKIRGLLNWMNTFQNSVQNIVF